MKSSEVLANYNKNLLIVVDCDASDYAVGAVISHIYPYGDERPISFASRTLNKNERNYSQVDKEGATVIFAVQKFRQYIFGLMIKLYVGPLSRRVVTSIGSFKAD